MLVCCLARAAAAQVTLTAQSSEPPVYEPQNIDVRGDGRCMTARPGDIVHYTLTIENVGLAPALYGDLRMRLGKSHELIRGDLPVLDFRSLGGGGLGTHEAADGKMYHFMFKVPRDIYGGTYHGVQVEVRPAEPQRPYYPSRVRYEPVSVHVPKVDVTRHTRDEVHSYCLNVISDFGMHPFETRPAITDFAPGTISAAPPAPAPQQPLKPEPLPPLKPGPPPQPR